MPSINNTSFLKIAKNLLASGIQSLPAITKPNKMPVVQWTDRQNNRASEIELQELFNKPHHAICVVCGKASGNLESIDFDCSGKYYEAWREIVAAKCPWLLDQLIIERSPSGGYHIYYRCETIEGNLKLAKDIQEVDGVAKPVTSIETRGNGGIIICAPTPGYPAIQGNLIDVSIISIEERQILFEAARSFNQYIESPKPKRSPSTNKPRDTFDNEGRPGDDFNERGDIRAVLQKHGWEFVKMDRDGLNELWRRPGKQFGHSASLHTQLPLFNVFSSNADPFDVKGYSYFDVYTILEHGGDHVAAARQLGADGFGNDAMLQDVELPEFILRPPGAPAPGDPPPKPHSESVGMNPGKFPEHLLNVPGYVNMLSKFINDTSFVTQPVLALASSLAFQALLCSQSIKDPLGTRPNINILAIGRSSSGKERGRNVIKEILSTLGNKPDTLYDANRFFFEDAASYQALIRKLETSGGRLIWLWDEIGKVLPSLRNDRTSHLSGILPVIMRLYTSSNTVFVPHIRASRDDNLPTIQQPHLILYGTSVPRNVLEGFSVESLTDGLMGRLLFFEGNDEADDRDDIEEIPPVSQDILDGADWWLTKRASVINPDIPNPETVPIDDEAKAVFKELHELKRKAREKGDDTELALWGRSVEQARQLSLIYAASGNRKNPIINKAAALWACELVAYLIRRKVYLASQYVADKEFDRMQKEVIRYIESCKGKCTKTMLNQKFRNWKLRERNEVIENLFETEAVDLAWEMRSGPGRPSCYIVIKK